MLCVATMYLTAEAIELAEEHGVKFEQFAPILDVSTGRATQIQQLVIGRQLMRAD